MQKTGGDPALSWFTGLSHQAFLSNKWNKYEEETLKHT
jgi:hypothetical protein